MEGKNKNSMREYGGGRRITINRKGNRLPPDPVPDHLAHFSISGLKVIAPPGSIADRASDNEINAYLINTAFVFSLHA